MSRYRAEHAVRIGVAVVGVLAAATLFAADPRKGSSRVKHSTGDGAPTQVVEFFLGIQQGQIQARLIAKHANVCYLSVVNHTDRPLSVQLPDAFGAMPVLAQQFSGSQGTVGNPGPTQALGMSPPPGAFSGSSQHGFMNVAPEMTSQLTLRSVCLERYKPGPSPVVPYQVTPLGRITSKPEIYDLCRMLSSADVSLRVVQAAAWHVNNEIDWSHLLYRGSGAALLPSTRFTQAELQGAQRLIDTAKQAAQQRAKKSGSGSTSTSSQQP